VPRHVGHGKVNSNCFDNSETIAVSMATNVTVHMTQGNDLLAVWYLLHAQIYTSCKGKRSCLHQKNSVWLRTGLTCHFTRLSIHNVTVQLSVLETLLTWKS